MQAAQFKKEIGTWDEGVAVSFFAHGERRRSDGRWVALGDVGFLWTAEGFTVAGKIELGHCDTH